MVVIRHRQHVVIGIVGVADRILGSYVARDTTLGVIVIVMSLASCVGYLRTNIQRVVGVSHRTAGRRPLGQQLAHVIIGVIGIRRRRTGKAGNVAQHIVRHRTKIVRSVTHRNVLSAVVVGVRLRMVQGIHHSLYLTKIIVGIGRGLPCRIRHRCRLVQAVVGGLADGLTLGIRCLDDIAVAVIVGGKYVVLGIRDGGSSAQRIVAITNDIILGILCRDHATKCIIGVGGCMIQRILDRQKVVVRIVGVRGHVTLGIGCRQHIAVSVIGVALGLTHRVGLTEQITCCGIRIRGHTRYCILHTNDLGHGVVLVARDVAIIVGYRQHVSCCIIRLHRDSALGIGFLGYVTDTVIFILYRRTICKFLGDHSAGIVVNGLGLVACLIGYLDRMILAVIHVRHRITVGQLDRSILHIAVIGVLGLMSVRIGHIGLLVITVVIGNDALSIGIRGLEQITCGIIFIGGSLVICIGFARHLTQCIVSIGRRMAKSIGMRLQQAVLIYKLLCRSVANLLGRRHMVCIIRINSYQAAAIHVLHHLIAIIIRIRFNRSYIADHGILYSGYVTGCIIGNVRLVTVFICNFGRLVKGVEYLSYSITSCIRFRYNVVSLIILVRFYVSVFIGVGDQ